MYVCSGGERTLRAAAELKIEHYEIESGPGGGSLHHARLIPFIVDAGGRLSARRPTPCGAQAGARRGWRLGTT